MLKGNKVLLRPVMREDIKYFLKWYNDPEVTRYLTMYLPMTEMAEEKWIERLATERLGKDVIFVIEILPYKQRSGKPIGSCGLHDIDHRNQVATAGLALGEKDEWEHGYGTEALKLLIKYGFEELNLHRISSAAFAPNIGSIKMQKKVGFHQEGRVRDRFFTEGEFCDEILFGMLKREYIKLYKKSA